MQMSYMADLSNWLTKDNQQNIKNLATAGNAFSILGQGRMSNVPDTRFQLLAKLAAGGAAGSDLIKPAPTQPPPTEEAPVNVAPQQTKVQQMPATDANKNGVPDYLERTITTTDKTKIPYNGVGSKQYQPTAIPGATPGQSLPEILANFQGSTGGQTAGTPVASDINPAPSAPVTQAAPSVQNLNTAVGNKLAGSGISPDAQRLQNIGLLLGPQAMMDTWKHGAVQDASTANLIEAQTKAQMAPSLMAKNTADATKTMWDMSPNAIFHAQLMENAKKAGDYAAERQHLGFLAAEADKVPLRDPILLSKGFKTTGDIIRATGKADPGIIEAAISAGRSITAAGIRAGGDMGAAEKLGIANQFSAMKALQAGYLREKSILSNELKTLTNPATTMLMTEKEKPAHLAKIAQLEGRIADMDSYLAGTNKILGEVAGLKIPSQTMPPPQVPPPAKLPVAFVPTGKLKGTNTQVMVYKGGAYDSTGKLIDVVK
jgi:hypothetical protein